MFMNENYSSFLTNFINNKHRLLDVATFNLIKFRGTLKYGTNDEKVIDTYCLGH